MDIENAKLQAVRLDTRIDDMSDRLDRTEERGEAIQHIVFQKLDSIERQGSNVQAQMSSLSARLESDQGHMTRQIDKLIAYNDTHDQMLRGSDVQFGLLVRTDRLEQYVGTSRWVLRAAVIALLTLCATSLARLVLAR